jgi:DNA repair protein RecO (recombination protein O)
MHNKRHTQVFVLRAVPYGERDVIVTLLSRELGRVSAMAKNARTSKRFAGGLELFRRAEAILEVRAGREMHLFLEMKVERSWPRIESSYEKITVGAYATELLRELAREGQPGEELFSLLERFYDTLEGCEDTLVAQETALRSFELELLGVYGATPSLRACHRCGRSHREMERLQCMRTGEGLLCVECRRPGEAVGQLERETLDALLYWEQPWQMVAPAVLDTASVRRQARRVLDASFQQILARPLKSRAMLDEVLT